MSSVRRSVRNIVLVVLSVSGLTAYAARPTAGQSKSDTVPVSSPVVSKAAMADAAADAVGVNTHLPYKDKYGPVWSTIIRPRLLESGIRHIRDWAVTDPTVLDEYRDPAGHGITGLLVNFDNNSATRNAVSRLNRVSPRFVEAVEPPNEQDGSGKDWVTKANEAQMGLWAGYKGDPSLRGIWILGPSFADTRDSPALFHSGAPAAGRYMDHGICTTIPEGKRRKDRTEAAGASVWTTR